MKVDYHMHTLCSDGICEVEAVVDMAVNCGILAMAVTDHDTLSGIGRARQCCLGRIRYVTGTEITCTEHLWGSLPTSQSIHLLGYGFDETDPVLCALLSARKERTEAVYPGTGRGCNRVRISDSYPGCPHELRKYPSASRCHGARQGSLPCGQRGGHGTGRFLCESPDRCQYHRGRRHRSPPPCGRKSRLGPSL